MKNAMRFILLLGVVSLFADVTYEGARSITGPFLSVLGASATIVGIAAGVGEFLGYSLRLISGYLADKTEKYWEFTIFGYLLNLLAVPLLALANHWEFAVFLLILERVGKGIRTPARDAMLSHATKRVGRGKGFGIHEAMDQIGAVAGPLMIFSIFYLKRGYREGFAILLIPAILALLTLIIARMEYPSPKELEVKVTKPEKSDNKRGKLPKVFWWYTLFIFLSIAGYANFQLISYHFKVFNVVSDTQIPIFYALAMGIDAIIALVAGIAYDRIGLSTLVASPIVISLVPFFSFSKSYHLALVGIILWGSAMGIQETIMRAAIADIVEVKSRATAYGIFNTAYGLSWLVGGVLMGVLYDLSIKYVVIFAVLMEIISLPLIFIIRGKQE